MKRRNFFLTVPGVLAAGSAIPKEQKEKSELKFADIKQPYNPAMAMAMATAVVVFIKTGGADD